MDIAPLSLSPLLPPRSPNTPIPLLAPEYLESCQLPNTPLTPLHPDVPHTPKMAPYTPYESSNAPDAPIPLLAPEYLESLSAPNTPWHPYTPHAPWHSQNDPYTPTPPRSLQCPLMPLYPFWFSIVVTLQLTVFIQLKCSFSIIVISNCHYFATDHLHSVKTIIFCSHHFQLLSLCNWPSTGVCPLYNIPSVVVKSTSSVLWSSTNFCTISLNMHYKAPVASQHWDQPSGLDMERWLTPLENFYLQKTFYPRGYLSSSILYCTVYDHVWFVCSKHPLTWNMDVIHYLIYCTLWFYCVTIKMPNEQSLCIPIKLPSSNWYSVNLHNQWKLFSEQCKFLLINDGWFSKHSEPAHIAGELN